MRRSTNHRLMVAALVTLAATACNDVESDVMGPDVDAEFARASNPNGRGRGGNTPSITIAFAAGTSGLYTVNPDGTGYSAISNTQNGTDPAWSPDRKKIAWVIPSGSGAGLYVSSANGGQRTRIYNGPAAAPAWSPSGTKIAFHGAVAGGTHVLVIDANGSNLQQATAVGTVNSHPTWSADGTKIAFFSNRSPGPAILVMNADGTQRQRIRSCYGCSSLSWSPVIGDRRIAYSISGDVSGVPYAAIGVINSDGTVPFPGPDQLVYGHSHGTTDLQPSWSPDATRLIFTSNMLGGTRELIVVNADGTSPVRLTTTAAVETAPAWAR